MPTALPCFRLRMPASHHTISPARSFVLGLLGLPVFFVLPTTMSPIPGYTKFKAAEQTILNYGQSRPLQLSLVVLAIAFVAWIVITHTSQRRGRTLDASVVISEKLIVKPLPRRQDSATCQTECESDHKNHLNSLKQEILEHTENPIFPWVLPPQTLPGPYDPMYYPLPAPSIRYKTSGSLATNTEGRHSASYTRLVPRSDIALGDAVLYGTITSSTNGWQRSHWNAIGG